jgi:acetyl-CoA carboxylase beta subunit
MIASNLQYHHALLLVKGLHLCQKIERHRSVRGMARIRAKIDHKTIEPLHKPIEALTTAAKAAVRKA